MARAKKRSKKSKGVPTPMHFRRPTPEEAEWPPEGVHSKSREGRKGRHQAVLESRMKRREARLSKKAQADRASEAAATPAPIKAAESVDVVAEVRADG
jgi:hypothetical protein